MYTFQIFVHHPLVKIFEGVLSFTSARRFMDSRASKSRPVSFRCFNDSLNEWYFSKELYIGNRLVIDGESEYLIDSDYRNMWKI